MPKTTSVLVAERRLQESVAALESLMDKLRAGEVATSPSDLAEAHAAVEAAELALEGARAQDARRKADERRRRAEKLHREALTSLSASTAQVAEDVVALREAANRLIGHVAAHNALVPKVRTDIREMGDLDSDRAIASACRDLRPALMTLGVVADVLATRRSDLVPVETEMVNRLTTPPASAEASQLAEIRRIFEATAASSKSEAGLTPPE